MNLPHQAHSLLKPVARAAPWVALAGGKGGVGKTLLAVNLAILAARSGYKTLLVDLDPGLANVDVHLRLATRATLENLARGECRLADALHAGPGGLTVLPGSNGSLWLDGQDREAIERVHAAVTRAASAFDVVFCDLGAGIGPLVLATLERSRLVVGVTTPDPAAVTDTYALCKLLVGRGRPLPHVVVNRARSRDEAMRTATRLSAVCDRFLSQPLRALGHVRDDQAFLRSIIEQRPLALAAECEALKDLRALAGALFSALPGLARRANPPAAAPLVAPRAALNREPAR